MESENLAKYHEFFVINLRILLHDIVSVVPETNKVKISANKLINALETSTLDSTNISGIVKKIYITVSANLKLLTDHNNQLFNIKEKRGDKNVIITLIPGINISEAYEYIPLDKRSEFWTVFENIFYSSVKLLEIANPEYVNDNIRKVVDKIQKNVNVLNSIKELRKRVPDTSLLPKEEFNPFVGVGQNNQEYSVNDIMSGPKDVSLNGENSNFGISSVASMMGVGVGLDKMLDLNKIAQELKNIDKKEIDNATANIMKLMGANVDSNASEMITMMLQDITSELKKDDLSKGNPLENIFKIADTVAQRIAPKIDPSKIDQKTMLSSTMNLAKNMSDSQGNKIFGNFESLANMMKSQLDMMDKNKTANMSKEDQVKLSKDMSKEMFKKMGMNFNEDEFNNITDSISKTANTNKKKKK